MIISIEGFDGTGKSTLVSQLKEKFPDVESYHFPSPEYLDKLHKAYQVFTKNKTLNNLLKYHVLFLEDFAVHQDMLKEKQLNKGKKVLLLDRYIYSHAAYANADIASFFIHNPKLEKNYGYCKAIMKLFYLFYSNLETPSMVIFLERSPIQNAPDELKTNFFYNLNFKDYAPEKLVNIRALSKSTLANAVRVIEKK